MNPMQIPAALTPATTGALQAVVFDPNEAPSTIVKDTQPFDVECTWYLDSPIIGFLSGQWRLQVAYESVGGGPEGVRSTANPLTPIQPGTPDNFHPNRRNYRSRVRFPANSLPLGGNPQRAYHLTAILSSTNQAGTAPGPFAAYYDLGVIQVMDA